MNKEKIYSLLIVLLPVGAIIFLTASFVYGWSEPTDVPPAGNVDIPLNEGALPQVKTGSLGINGVLYGYSDAIFDGSVGIGVAPTEKLDINGNIKAMGDIKGTALYTTQKVCLSGGDGCLNFTGTDSYGREGFRFSDAGGNVIGTSLYVDYLCLGGVSCQNVWGAGPGPGGAVDSVTGLDGILVSPTTGSVTVRLDTSEFASAGGCDDPIADKVIWNSVAKRLDCATDREGVAGSGYTTIQDEGSSLAQRTILNFTGAGVTCADSGGKTNCDISGGAVGGLPGGTGAQTLRHDGSNWVASSILLNNGTYLTVAGSTPSLYMAPSGSQGNIYRVSSISNTGNSIVFDAGATSADITIDTTGNVTIDKALIVEGSLALGGALKSDWNFNGIIKKSTSRTCGLDGAGETYVDMGATWPEYFCALNVVQLEAVNTDMQVANCAIEYYPMLSGQWRLTASVYFCGSQGAVCGAMCVRLRN